MPDALERIAALASTLREAKLRVLLELTRRAGRGSECRYSPRELARTARVSRPNIQAAIDSLSERVLIICDGGNATRASSYRLAFLDAVLLYSLS